jgi:hypothetical protein
MLLLESFSVELLTVCQREAVESHDLPAGLGEKSGNSELISFLNHFLLPTNSRQHVRTIRFDPPLLDFTFVIFYVKPDKHMRIGPLKTCHSPFQRDSMFLVEWWANNGTEINRTKIAKTIAITGLFFMVRLPGSSAGNLQVNVPL